MSANKLEQFEVAVIGRSTVNQAPYNPRRISKENRKKLSAFLKTHGLWQALIVNKRTMNLVSGHQRLGIMDQLMSYPKCGEYEITVNLVDVDIDTEKKGNVFMNNQSAMGEFDNDLLKDLFLGLDGGIENFDNITEMGFDRLDVESIFAGDSQFLQSVYNPQTQVQEELTEEMKEQKRETYRAARQEERDMRKAEAHAEGDDYQSKHDDYMITFVCQTNTEKQRIMKALGYPEAEKFAKVGKLYDIQDGKIRVYGQEAF